MTCVHVPRWQETPDEAEGRSGMAGVEESVPMSASMEVEKATEVSRIRLAAAP